MFYSCSYAGLVKRSKPIVTQAMRGRGPRTSLPATGYIGGEFRLDGDDFLRTSDYRCDEAAVHALEKSLMVACEGITSN